MLSVSGKLTTTAFARDMPTRFMTSRLAASP